MATVIDTSSGANCTAQVERHYEYPCDENVMSAWPPSVPPSVLSPNSPSPAPIGCKSSNGVWGTISGNATLIEFTYELETTQGDQSYVESQVLPVLEQAMVDSILPVIFAQCGSRRSLRVERRLQVVGVSKNPPDLILPSSQGKLMVRGQTLQVSLTINR